MLAAAFSFARGVNPAKLKINGLVGLDSTYARVVKALGKPTKETRPQAEECTGGHEKTVKYTGLSLYFMDGSSRDKKTYMVMSFEVTRAGFTVSGVKVGDSEAVVRRLLGRPKSIDNADGEKIWQYEIPDPPGPGWTSISFKNGKVTNIASSYTVC